MEVILTKDVEKLGYKDELVKVKNGFGRNYLIPRKIALLATKGLKKHNEGVVKQRAVKLEKAIEDARKTAVALKSMVVKVGVKVGEKGKIFGSVNSLQLAEAMKKLGYNIDRKDISLKEDPIKNTGKYQADIRFLRGYTETITFEVVGEE